MKWITLDYIKAHSRIDLNCEDDLLTLYGESAETTVLNIVGRTYDEIVATYGEIPIPLYHAALMLVETSYAQRSPVSQVNLYTVPYTFDLIVKPYMRLSDHVQQ